ncbi:MAG TPA: class I SAM-dependent methyltransferase [Thermomicrobiaceae bacterium]|nr:class I SAM-dependent methyltransferase [Thermomicrobiaceae bacterium]
MAETESEGWGALRRPPEIQAMFDRIVRRYDLMNRLMSGGRDAAWRRLAAREAVGAGARQVLDLATGTGDLALELARQGAVLVVGADLSRGMLGVAAGKVHAAGRPPVALAQVNAMALPFAGDGLDACTVAFGLRNMPDYRAAIVEMARVLRPGGRLVILEMTPLRRTLPRTAFAWYFDRIVPVVGGLISGDRDAYRYLPRSVGAFPDAETLAEMMRDAGLRNVRYRLLALRTVALHVGVKP